MVFRLKKKKQNQTVDTSNNYLKKGGGLTQDAMYARELRKWSLKYRMSYLWLSAIVIMLLLIIYCPNAASMHLPIKTIKTTRDPVLRISSGSGSGSSTRSEAEAEATIATDSSSYNWWLERLTSSPSSSPSKSSNRQQQQNIDSTSYLSSSRSILSNNQNQNQQNQNSLNNQHYPLAVFSDLRNHNARARAPVNELTTTTTALAPASTSTSINHNQFQHTHNVPNSNSQINLTNLNFNAYASNSLTNSNAYDLINSSRTRSSNSSSSINSLSSRRRSNKLRRHTNTNNINNQQQPQQPNANYHSPVRVEGHLQPAPFIPYTLLPRSTSTTVQRYAITAYHVPPESSPPLTAFDQHRRRRLLLRQQARNRTLMMAARSRRDSTTTSGIPLGFLRNAPSNHQHKHNRNNNNNNNYHHHNHNHNRKRPRRYCSARDPAQLAFEAPTVFEGKIISMTRERRANFSVTFEVKEIFKKQIGFRLQKYVRLNFAYRNTSAECDIYREFLRPRGLVRGDELEQGRIYVLFVQQSDSSNFTILGQPIRKTQHVIQAVKKAVSDKYAQLASIKSITASNRTVENGKELRIVCKVQGQPPPKVTWFKDHKSINRNRRLYQFIHYKRRSELIIRSFNSSDAGRYECRAKNKVNQNLERRAIVIKAFPMPRYDTPTQQSGGKCPEYAYEFCFNGGTCKFFTEIGSYSCVCPEGFIGERCDRKEVPSTYSNEQECGDKKYLGSYYC